jgi:anti-anti-sigma factor
VDHLLDIDVRPDRDRVTLVLTGELDHFTAFRVRAAIRELLECGWRRVVLDLRPLKFMDAGGVNLLEELAGGRLGAGDFSMFDGVEPVALPLAVIGKPRVLPLAEDSSARRQA